MRKIESICLAIVAAFLALAIPARGQEKEEPPKATNEKQGEAQKATKDDWVRKVISLKYAEPGAVARLLGAFGTNMIPDNRMKVITIAGHASAVEAVEEAIKKLDVPPPPTNDIDVTAYFVLAAREPMEAANLPKELDEVVTQLKRIMNYQSFQLLNTAFLRVRDGEGGTVSGVARVGSAPVDFHLGFNGANIISEGKVRSVRIGGLDFQAEQLIATTGNAPVFGPKTTSAKIHTNIDITEGQKVVVGKTALNFPDNALILVLTAKVID